MNWYDIRQFASRSGLYLIPFVPLVVSSSLFFPYITGKAFIFRLIVEILLGLWLVGLIFEPAARPRRSGLLWAVAALIGVTTLATLFGVDPFRSFWSNFERMDGLITYLHLGAYFLLLIATLRTETWWRWWLGTSLGVSGIMVIYALVEYSRLAPGASSRLAATLGNPIYLAVYLLLHLFIAAWFWTWVTERWQKVALALLMLAQLWALYQTGTRSAILGLGAGILTALILVGWRGRAYPRARRWAGVALIALVLLGGVFWLGRDSQFVASRPLLARFANISLEDATTRHRLLNWQMAWQGFKERPLLGWGPENYIQVFAKYFDPALYDAEPWFDRTHNILFDWLVSGGLLGLLSYLALYVVALYYLWRRESAFRLAERIIFTGLLIAYLVHNFFVFDSLSSYLLFFGLLGYWHFRIVTVPATSFSRRENRQSWRFPLALATLVLVGGGIYWLNYQPWRVNRLMLGALSNPAAEGRLAGLSQALALDTLGRTEAAEQLISESLNIVRDSAAPASTQATAAALVEAKIAPLLVVEPDNIRLTLFYGSFLRARGEAVAAIPYLEAARELAPRKQGVLFELAQAYLAADRPDEALEVARAAYEAAPDFADAVQLYAFILTRTNRPAEAAALLRALQSRQSDATFNEATLNTYVAAGNFAAVLAWWQARVAEEPENFQYRISLSAAYLKMGQREKSIAELMLAKKIDPNQAAGVDYLINEIRAGRDPSAR
jgi:O-antigen ligase